MCLLSQHLSTGCVFPHRETPSYVVTWWLPALQSYFTCLWWPRVDLRLIMVHNICETMDRLFWRSMWVTVTDYHLLQSHLQATHWFVTSLEAESLRLELARAGSKGVLFHFGGCWIFLSALMPEVNKLAIWGSFVRHSPHSWWH